MIRSLPQLDFDAERLAALCQRWQIAELAVFGSAARGEMRPDSDVDLMVEFDASARWTLWDFVSLKDELEELLRHPVDLVEKGTVKNPFRRRTIERDLTTVYAGSQP